MGLYNDAIIFEANPFVINGPGESIQDFYGSGFGKDRAAIVNKRGYHENNRKPVRIR